MFDYRNMMPRISGLSGAIRFHRRQDFFINQEEVIYEKDLGKKSGETAVMITYDPDQTLKQYKKPL